MQTSDPVSPPSPLRALATIALFVLSGAILLLPFWRSMRPAGGAGSPDASPGAGSAELLFTQSLSLALEAKYWIGALALAKKAGPDSQEQLKTAYERWVGDQPEVGSDLTWPLRLTLLDHLGAEAQTMALKREIESGALRAGALSASITDGVRKLYLESTPLGAAELAELQMGLGPLFGPMVQLKNLRLSGAAAEEIEALADSIERDAIAYVIFLGALLLAVIAATVAGLVMLILFIQQTASGRLPMRMGALQSPAGLHWETFALYLALMAFSPWLIRAIAPEAGGLGASFLIELFVPVVACYPLLAGASPADLRADLGLGRGIGLIRESLLGLLGYIAGLPLIGLALVALIILTKLLGLEVEQGAHPIVYMIKGGQTSVGVILFALVLAVIIAPVLEEVMFRGYFYRALRSRLGAPASIAICSAFFAAVHPQGIIGFPLLFAIGAVLATLREWRGSLAAPIAAHACTNGVTMTLVLMM